MNEGRTLIVSCLVLSSLSRSGDLDGEASIALSPRSATSTAVTAFPVLAVPAEPRHEHRQNTVHTTTRKDRREDLRCSEECLAPPEPAAVGVQSNPVGRDPLPAVGPSTRVGPCPCAVIPTTAKGTECLPWSCNGDLHRHQPRCTLQKKNETRTRLGSGWGGVRRRKESSFAWWRRSSYNTIERNRVKERTGLDLGSLGEVHVLSNKLHVSVNPSNWSR